VCACVDVLYRMIKKSLIKYLENKTFKKKMFYTKIVKFRQMHQSDTHLILNANIKKFKS